MRFAGDINVFFTSLNKSRFKRINFLTSSFLEEDAKRGGFPRFFDCHRWASDRSGIFKVTMVGIIRFACPARHREDLLYLRQEMYDAARGGYIQASRREARAKAQIIRQFRR